MRKINAYFIAAVASLSALPAAAELNDPPYFNLWSNATTGSNGELGDATDSGPATTSLCGTLACNSGSTDAKNFGIFRTVAPNYGKGSGAIDPFLRFHHNEGDTANGSQTWEAAFNTDFRNGPNETGTIILDPNQFSPTNNVNVIDNQAKDHSAFNHALMLGDLRKAVDADGNFHFMLDINEPGQAKGTLRLDELAFFVGATGDLSELTQDEAQQGNGNPNLATVNLAGAKNGGNAIWDMDYDSDVGGLILDNINDSGPAGSGDYDMELLLSSELFASYSDTDYVYLYNFMGEADNTFSDEAEAGFEEWAFDTSAGGGMGGGTIPEPGTLLLSLAGLAALASKKRIRQR
ncbi:MAG: hypothetical protein ACI915_004757 [Gammaproteobacteria bacterium]|jgi:hypothetical protein